MKLLVTGAWQHTQEDICRLEGMGHQIIFHKNEKDALCILPTEIEGVICNGLFLHHPIEQFENLKYIQLTSAGFDRVPMEYVKMHGIKIFNARGVYSIPMAEFALCSVLQLYKQSKFFMHNQENGLWDKHRGLFELCGKTVLIAGCGNVGTECAKRFSAFGCKVLGADIFEEDKPYFDKVYHISKLAAVLDECDIVVLTLPLTDETRHLFDADMFGVMKEQSVLVNIARGAVVDTEALIGALKNKLFGAVLDVFEEEPLGESELWDMDNVILTPHNSFVGENNSARLRDVIFSNLEGCSRG